MAVPEVSSMRSQNSVSSPDGHARNALEASAKIVDLHTQQDNSYPQLLDCLKMDGSLPSVSGLNDQDYPGLTELSSLHSIFQFNTVKKIPLPAELVEQFGHMQSNCQMGLFPEIERAWLTIDSDIFMWSFEDGSDLAYFDGLNETVLCVGLIKPKPGIFQNYIHYLLCLTTPVEIALLGVSFSRQHESSSPFEEMHLLPEPLFSFPTDNTYMVSVEGTSDGRIFLGGRDGAIYEFAYQAEDGWFSRKCRKINHSSGPLSFLVPSFLNFAFSEEDAVIQIIIDNSRHILYALSEKGAIQVFDLGNDGNQMSKVAYSSQNSIVQNAVTVARNIDRSNFYPIVHINVLEITESISVHLVAITQSGVRLYFTTNSELLESRPNTLLLLHVRLPPGYSASASLTKPSYVHTAHHRKGLMLLASRQSENQDILWASSNDSFPFPSKPRLMEIHTTVHLDGHTWALSEIPTSLPLKPYHHIVVQNTLIPSEPPVVITQHMELPRKFVLLSGQGSHILTKPRPVDQLQKLLVVNNGPDCEAVKAFFFLHQVDQACAMCLILACSQNPQGKQVAEWASRAFFIYGGEPFATLQTSGDASNIIESPLPTMQKLTPLSTIWSSTPTQQNVGTSQFSSLSFSGVCSPVMSANPQSNVQNVSMVTQQYSSGIPSIPASGVQFSGKHNGLYLYFSRIMRTLWYTKLISNLPVHFTDPTAEFLTSSVSSDELSIYLQQLLALKDFIQTNSQLFGNITSVSSHSFNPRVLEVKNHGSAPGDLPSIQQQMQQQKKAQTDAELQERISLLNLQQLVSCTCEMLGLWKILCDHQFHIVVSMIPLDLQNQLKSITFKDFIISGKELTGALVNAVISVYLEDNASTNTISQRLLEVCPSIYRIEDATFSKANEILLNAKNIVNRAERERELREALKLCKVISPHLNLGSMCSLFQSAHFYHGIVDLCLCAAQRGDPQGLALHFYRNGEPPDDQQGLQAYLNRMKCYKAVIDTISNLMSLSMSHPQSPSVPKSPGPPPPRDPNLLSPEEAKNYSEQMFEMSLKIDDELFHVALYDWLIENNQTETLLSIKSHFLENYLKRCTTLQPENMPAMDLLWKFYEKSQNFSAAARILAKLAEKHGSDINLAQRLEYLSRAIMCVKSSEIRVCTPGEGEFLHELEEKMEVARIQLNILDTLERKYYSSAQDPIFRLNSNLLDITQLYEDYTEPFDMPENKLAIIHCAGHYDPTLIECLWQSIIDKELIDTVKCTTATRIKALSMKIVNSSKKYVSSEKYFPLASIVKYLELKTCTMDADKKWVFSTMLELSISMVDLLDVYHRLYRSKDSCWLSVKRPLHLLQVLSLLIGHFVDVPTVIPSHERRSFSTLCLDVIAGYLVDLQAMNIVDSMVSTVMKEFKVIQHKLERFL